MNKKKGENKIKTKNGSDFSLIDKDFIKSIVKTAKMNIEKDGELTPVFFIRMKNKKENVITPMLLDTNDSEVKARRVTAMGKVLKEKLNDDIEEAVMLSDAYMIIADKKGKMINNTLPVRDNPTRTECIVIMGRNKDRSRMVIGTLPYRRKGKSIFFIKEHKKLEFSGGKEKLQSVGLVDYLFSYQEAEMLHKVYGSPKKSKPKN